MKNKQRGETRKTLDIIRFFEDSNFNLGLAEERTEEDTLLSSLEVEPKYVRPKLKSAFHIRLSQLMKKQKINKTQLGRDIAKAVGKDKPIARQTLDNYMSGKTHPTIDVVIYLCQRFGCSADYLLGLSSYVTDEDENIGYELGLTPESVDYLRARNKVPNDTVIDAVNLLLKDSDTYRKELRAKKEGHAPSAPKGKNVLFYLYRFLNVEKQNTLETFSHDDWTKLSADMVSLFDELELDTQDQKIGYYREKVERLKRTYSDICPHGKTMPISESALLTVYFQQLENSIRGLRKVLQMQSGQ